MISLRPAQKWRLSMLERYYIRPDTIDRIQASWIAGGIERYVEWLTEHQYAARNVFRRVPILRRFGDVARARGAATWEDLPRHVDAFVAGWVQERGQHCRSDRARRKVADEARNPIEQMLALVVPGFVGRGRARGPREPFAGQAGAFFEYLRSERGLRDASVLLYRHHLAQFDAYLQTIGLVELTALSPAILGAFVVESGRRFGRTSMRSLCGILRVFLRYLHREHLLPKDLSASVESPRAYRLATIPRAITWDEVRRMLEAVDRRSTTGKRDYAILLLLVTYGLRAREVAALTLDDLDWKRDRLRIPERKAGHSTAYPLSPTVGAALVEYLQHGRPLATDRRIFFRVLAPPVPLTTAAVSSRVSHYLHRAGIAVARPGSHTLRHTCVQRLVDAEVPFKVIGDYVGHRAAASTEIYTKVALDALREVALGDGETIL
jgi:integrase/recombinase XerD